MLPLLLVVAVPSCPPVPIGVHGGAYDGEYERQELERTFLCEGASHADLDRDGHQDLISGPYWYRGPDFTERSEIYPPKAFDPAGYSDNFFAFPHDLDGDGWLDVFFVGFPGESAAWYTNPRGAEGHWQKHVVIEHVDGESPIWADLTGDGAPELVFITGGHVGWAGPTPGAPEEPWTFHALSGDLGLQRFTHGLGVGDVDGDGRADVLLKDGWFQQPATLTGDPVWTTHRFPFSQKHGGAQMLVQDVDGDGDADVITSLAAHEFGLVWWEQVPAGADAQDPIAFVEHVMMGDEPSAASKGVRFGELHALCLADVDGDGLDDVVTGKRWWSHGAKGDPDGGAVPPVVYAFLLRREGATPASGRAHYEPLLLDDGSGVGVQVVAGDVDADGKPDVIIGNKNGTFVLRSKATGARPASADPGQGVGLDLERGDLSGWTAEGEAFAGQPVKGDTVSARGREPSLHAGEYWIGGYELVGDDPRGTLTSDPFPVTQPWASFLIAGGEWPETCVEVRRVEEDGGRTVLFRSSGANVESLQRVVVDLRKELGHSIDVHLVDDREGHWGHINFDDFRFHASQPSFPRPPGVPEIRPRDTVQHAGLAPQDAAKAMTVPEGFQVELVAGEPDLHQPIALTCDAKGRLWVVEAFTYPRKAPEGEGKDDVLVFEDRDHDGTFETRTVFATGLNLVSGLEVGHGGVWIGAAPQLLFIPDGDDDLVPDREPIVLLDGWGYQDTHETLNAFTWGPDGWLYGCHGVFTHSRVGRPGCPDEERVPINAGVWRFHPVREEFEVFAWGTSNPWGVVFDENGQCFVTACVIPHLYHLAQGGRYLRQAGKHFESWITEDIDTIADHRHWIGSTPHSGNLRSNAAGGGHAHCGALIYQAEAFPPEWRGRILMNNIHGNRVNSDVLTRTGSTFSAAHGDDLLLSNDKWFRGIALELSPEGSLYVIDWYDQQACHWTDPAIWDRTNGRLYRVSYGEHRPQAVDLTAKSSPDLVKDLYSKNEWLARRARVTLAERGRDPQAEALLRRSVKNDDARLALRALWALNAIAGIDDRLGLESLHSWHEYIRAWTVQCLLERRSPSVQVLGGLARQAVHDDSPVVRLYLASGLQRIPVEQRFELAEALARRAEDAADPVIPLMLWWGIEPLLHVDAQRVFALARSTPIERLRGLVWQRAAGLEELRPVLVAEIARTSEPEVRRALVDTLADAVRAERGLAAPTGWAELYADLAGSTDAHLRDQALEIAIAFGDPTAFPALRALVQDDDAPSERRVRALEALVRGKDPLGAPVLLASLDRGELRGTAVRGLAAYDHPEVAAALLSRYADLSAEERRDAVATLGARALSARALVAAIGDGTVARSELSAFQLRALRQLGDAEVDRLLDEHVGQVRPPDEGKQDRIAEVLALLGEGGATPPSLPAGREVFQRTCQQCHTLFGVGGTLGPELTGANRGDVEYLVTTVIDPSGVVPNEYRTTVAWLKDGRIVTGIERGRTATSVTLATETGDETLALSDVDDLQLSDLSTMPEGLLDALSPEEVRALFAYLGHPNQTAVRATPANVASFFDGATLAGWHGDASVWQVEGDEIVGRTDGLDRNSFLRSELELSDFRLTLEVKLVADAGNSGIQFRSTVLEDGDVTGYQADVGPGWWGKLYEEHGRAVLVDRESSAVRKGEWNRYVIECRGAHVSTWLNGELCVDLEDPDGAREGIVALQVHSGGATEVRFRNLALELLD
jgi:putative membrane-bound dehydrogenase-like protein